MRGLEKVILRGRFVNIFDMKMKWQILAEEEGDEHRKEALRKHRGAEKDGHKLSMCSPAQ